ncbi:DegT/DnrJ/EryC1/StrS family aminotransferase [Marinilabiliaceae bacterium JC017]|nr:DegT/DnrJ/EryC1/StrS family aminotransferase [Marinilabiliaceae bacterium JC017]
MENKTNIELNQLENKPVSDKYLVFGSPNFNDEEYTEIVEVLKSNWIGTGPRAHRFEEMFCAYKGADYAVSVNSCTAGLFLSLLATGLEMGDEVLVCSMTFCATANVVEHIKAKPVLVDCELNTMNVSIDDLKRKITPKTKGIILVHFAGRPISNIREIVEIAKEKNIAVIEDCAHAIETELDGQKAGTFGDIASFSFYVTKNITTGEGGMIITNNKEYADKVKVLALHGMSKDAWKRFSDDGYNHYEVVYPGYKYNMTDLQAALGIKQLEKIDPFYQKREKIWNFYNDALKDLPLITPYKVEANSIHAYHLYTILLELEKLNITRDQFITLMHKENIGTGVHYRAIHLQKYYRETYNYRPEDFPNATRISERTVSLPLSSGMSDSDMKNVVTAIKKIVAQHGK